jgi:hypothetical protein
VNQPFLFGMGKGSLATELKRVLQRWQFKLKLTEDSTLR